MFKEWLTENSKNIPKSLQIKASFERPVFKHRFSEVSFNVLMAYVKENKAYEIDYPEVTYFDKKFEHFKFSKEEGKYLSIKKDSGLSRDDQYYKKSISTESESLLADLEAERLDLVSAQLLEPQETREVETNETFGSSKESSYTLDFRLSEVKDSQSKVSEEAVFLWIKGIYGDKFKLDNINFFQGSKTINISSNEFFIQGYSLTYLLETYIYEQERVSMDLIKIKSFLQ